MPPTAARALVGFADRSPQAVSAHTGHGRYRFRPPGGKARADGPVCRVRKAAERRRTSAAVANAAIGTLVTVRFAVPATLYIQQWIGQPTWAQRIDRDTYRRGRGAAAPVVAPSAASLASGCLPSLPLPPKKETVPQASAGSPLRLSLAWQSTTRSGFRFRRGFRRAAERGGPPARSRTGRSAGAWPAPPRSTASRRRRAAR